jgi:hypothetical protein
MILECTCLFTRSLAWASQTGSLLAAVNNVVVLVVGVPP